MTGDSATTVENFALIPFSASRFLPSFSSCIEHCVEDFQKDPKKFLAKLEAAKKGELPKPTTEGPDEGEQPEEPSETSEETENDEKPAPTSQDSSE